MTWLILGVLLWVAAHLFKRVLPEQRAALGNRGKAVVAAVIAVSVILMIVGYRAAPDVYFYALPYWAWYLNNLAMFAAIFLMGVGGANGVVRTRLRHPMLLGLVLWSAAHLLVNGDLAPLVLFGGLGAWALLEMAVISRAEGPWQPPARGSWLADGRVALVAVGIYAVIAGIHHWLGYPVFVLL